MDDGLAITADLLGEPARAAMLVSLVGGISLPAGELARVANISPPTASVHLARMVDGRLLEVERQGRHRYYRLADDEVAHLVEALLVVTGRSQPVIPAGGLAFARTCYSHLAGWLGLQIADAMEKRELITGGFEVTAAGTVWLERLGVEVGAGKRCLDWTERRHHLAGPLGCSLYRRCRELKWIAPLRNTRAVRVTLEGKTKFWELLRIPIG